jgi:cellulose biosynthesis protein BcsQ
MLNALSFGANRNLASLLNQLCALTQEVSIFRSLEHYPQAHETMRLLNSFAPHLVFLGIDDEAAAGAVEHDIRSILPSAAILGVSGNPRNARVFESSFGQFPTLALPCAVEEFRAATLSALDAGSEKRTAPVFAFLPAKAGSGSTTTALFVANILSRLAQKKVLFLECDLHAGPVSMLYNVRPSHSIVDALDSSHSLNDASWKEMVTAMDSIDVLPSIGRGRLRMVTAWEYQRLLSFVRSRYDLVIADLPEVVNDATEAVVRAAKAVFIVTTPSTPSLFLASRRRYSLEARGVGATKVKYVLNRQPRNKAISREAGSLIDAEKIATIPIDDGLFDTSEFRLEFARPETIAAYATIAEYCSGTVLVPKRTGFRKSWFEGWTRVSSRPLELYSQSAAQ